MANPLEPGPDTAAWQRALFVAFITQFGCSSTFDDLKLATEANVACESAIPPLPPPVVTSDFSSVEFVTAVEKYDVGEVDHGTETERYRTMGYDLDDTCTGQGQGPSCASVLWPIDPAGIDGPDGRDNAQGAVFYRVHQRQGTSITEGLNDPITNGTITTVIRVRGYNEERLDSKVEVAVFGASLTLKGRPPPAWDGNDAWAVGEPWWVERDENDKPSTELPRYFDTDAYVVDSILVAHLDQLEVPPETLMSQVVISARIERTEHGWALTEGTFAGRLKTDDILASLQGIRDPETNEYICRDSVNYPTHKQNICALSDISFAESEDPSTLCDATSWGWHFNALPAKLSDTVSAPVPDNCKPPRLSPATDSCANP